MIILIEPNMFVKTNASETSELLLISLHYDLIPKLEHTISEERRALIKSQKIESARKARHLEGRELKVKNVSQDVEQGSTLRESIRQAQLGFLKGCQII